MAALQHCSGETLWHRGVACDPLGPRLACRGCVTALPQDGDLRSHHIEVYRDVILGSIDANVDITLVELSELLHRKHEVSFASSTVWRFPRRHDLTFKKTAHASEQERPGVAARRQRTA
jgi:hypothetical protein